MNIKNFFKYLFDCEDKQYKSIDNLIDDEQNECLVLAKFKNYANELVGLSLELSDIYEKNMDWIYNSFAELGIDGLDNRMSIEFDTSILPQNHIVKLAPKLVSWYGNITDTEYSRTLNPKAKKNICK